MRFSFSNSVTCLPCPIYTKIKILLTTSICEAMHKNLKFISLYHSQTKRVALINIEQKQNKNLLK